MTAISARDRLALKTMVRALLILWLCSICAFAQGTVSFRVTVTGFETVEGTRFPVRGSGTLALSGSSLSYDISVPYFRALPAEAHFHGPSVQGEPPIFSLAPYVDYGDFIRYTGSRVFDSKWLPDIRDRKWYVQLHNAEYENGVLRGDIIPVPEPSVAAFSALCLLILGSSVRRR